MDQQEMLRYIDAEGAIGRVLGNKALYKKLLRSFLDNGYTDALRADIARGDLQTASRSAHSLKGLSANLSLLELHKLMLELEDCLKNGKDYREAYKRFDSVLEMTEKCINTVLEQP